jgi:hypothetical protein
MTHAGKVALLLGLLGICSAQGQTTNLYHTNRVFRPLTFTNFPSISAYRVVTMAGQLTEVVGPTNVFINTNTTKAVEYEGFAWGYESANAAWTSAVAVYQSYSMDHAGMIYDNAGWVKGTKEAYGTWGAFLWYLQNQIAFESSPTSIWISSQSVTSPILQVLVGSLGDYPPQASVLDVGPTNWAQITNFLGAGVSTDVVYRANLDTYYEILIPDVLVSPRTNSLLMTNVFTAMSYPTRLAPSNYLFQIRRASSATWYTLTNGTASAYTTVVAVAGNFKVRVTVCVSNATATSRERDFTAQFPSYAEIVANTAVVQHTDQAWSNTLAATTPTGRREEGFWIQVNTQTRLYEFTQTILGPTVPAWTNGSIQFGSRPADSPTNPPPNGAATYTVASFHTHTPTIYRNPPDWRKVGPSTLDSVWNTYYDVAGIVYDYVGSQSFPANTNFYIPMGHPLGDPAMRYHSGPERRKTPQ